MIVPVGGTEQSGPLMARQAQRPRPASPGRIAESLGNALVAPVIAYVPEGSIEPPAAHMRFAGTISIPEAAFETTLEYAARSFRRHGFRDIVLIGDHGGYQKSLVKVAAKLNREWAARRSAFMRSRTTIRRRPAATISRRFGARATARRDRQHAGVADTSLMLAIDPRLVRSERLRDGPPLGPAEGVQGDPRRASATAGLPGRRPDRRLYARGDREGRGSSADVADAAPPPLS